MRRELGESDVIALTREPIDAEKLVAAAKRGEDGAVVVFDGIVRNNTRGRRDAASGLRSLRRDGAEADAGAWPSRRATQFGVRHVTIVHRLGRLEVGETSVLIVVASAHRGAGLRGLPLADRHAQEDRAHLEERDLCRRSGVGRRRAVPGGLALEPEASHERRSQNRPLRRAFDGAGDIPGSQ